MESKLTIHQKINLRSWFTQLEYEYRITIPYGGLTKNMYSYAQSIIDSFDGLNRPTMYSGNFKNYKR